VRPARHQAVLPPRYLPRIAVEGMGPEQPLESNDEEAGRALNRRVEITVGR